MRNSHPGAALGLLLLVSAIGCGGSSTPDSSRDDAGTHDPADSGHVDPPDLDDGADAGPSDGGVDEAPDAGHDDGGEPDSGTPDAGGPSDGGSSCVPFTCEILLRDYPLGSGQQCREYDDGCGERVQCGCEAGVNCSSNACVCVETLTPAEICAQAMTCGSVSAPGRCGTVYANCRDPDREPSGAVCERMGCGTFEITGQWCSWTEHCPCAEGTVCDDETRACVGLTDARDGRSYPIIRIGQQIWMAKNLQYNAPGSGCSFVMEQETECWRWGRYYTWGTALAGAAASNSNPSGVQGVCPAGWHLPSDAEMVELMDFISSQKGSSAIAAHLKYAGRSGLVVWSSGLTYDSYGFSLFPAGERHGLDTPAVGMGTSAFLWTSSGFPAARRYQFGVFDAMYPVDNSYPLLASVRCVRD